MGGSAERLLEWIGAPAATRGLRFANDLDGWDLVTYEELAARAARAARALRDAGAGPGGVVSLVLPTGPDFVAAFYGALLAGAAPSPVAPPVVFENTAKYVEHAAQLLRAARASLVVTDPDLAPLVADACAAAGVAPPVGLQSSGDERAPAGARRGSELALLQFTSGSSGSPRAVGISFDNLAANIGMIGRWLDITRADVGATWLPLYHDMGLIGMLLTPVTTQQDLWIMRPDQFIRSPARWLECFGVHGATITAAPTFGYGLVAKRVLPEQLAGMDFSGWKAAIVGAERLDAHALGRFTALLRPRGLRPEAIMPAYGLAEATLAVTGRRLDAPARAVRLASTAVSFGEPVDVVQQRPVDGSNAERATGWLVGSGEPHAALEVEIVGDDGELLPPGSVGEVRVRGPSVARGYVPPRPEDGAKFTARGLRTGDCGFVLDGELFVVGRIGDSLKVRGRSVFAEDIEAQLARVEGVPRHRCVALAAVDELETTLAVVFEAVPGPWVDDVVALLESTLGGDVRLKVLTGPPGTIMRTSSGKPRRRVMWQHLVAGTLSARVAYDSSGADAPPVAAHADGA